MIELTQPFALGGILNWVMGSGTQECVLLSLLPSAKKLPLGLSTDLDHTLAAFSLADVS